MSLTKRYFEHQEEELNEVIEQGIQFNDLDYDDEEDFYQLFEYESTYEEAKRIYFNKISRRPKDKILEKFLEEIRKNKNKNKGDNI